MANDIKNEILKILGKNTQGLTISKIAKLVGVHRTTIPKHLYELKGEGKVRIREIGSARVFFLNNKFLKRIEDEKIIRRLRSAM